jgi:hypothetical protein
VIVSKKNCKKLLHNQKWLHILPTLSISIISNEDHYNNTNPYNDLDYNADEDEVDEMHQYKEASV